MLKKADLMVTLNKIYTRTGDKGTTALGNGERTEKFDLRVIAYGSVDELNSNVGLAVQYANESLIQDLQMKEISPIMKLVVRGKKREFISAVGKSLNILLPTEANTSTQSDKLTALWLSPDEWMIFSNDTMNKDLNDYETEKLLQNNISKINLGAVTDVTDQFVMINLKGNKIYELFQSGSPFNFNNFKNKKGATTQTILGKIDIIVHNQDKNTVNLFVRRSFSEHLFSWMNDAASRL